MTQHTHTIKYTIYRRPLDTPDDEQLCVAAEQATRLAYAPYSNFKVGAAARLSDGQIVSAANLENAAYPQCLCAEASLLGTVHTQHPGLAICKIAIATSSQNLRKEVAAPCGSCRQQLSEAKARQATPITLMLVDQQEGVHVFEDVGDLLPFGFSL